MRYCGISEYFPRGGISFIDESGNIEFASQSERYSKNKNDMILHPLLLNMIDENDEIYFYEDPYLKQKMLKTIGLDLKYPIPDKYNVHKFLMHHESHAALAFYTRPWESKDDTILLTIDGYGEYQSACIYDSNFKLRYSEQIPRSIGYVYALATRALGYKALEEEYTVMGMAAYGEPEYMRQLDTAIKQAYFKFSKLTTAGITFKNDPWATPLKKVFYKLQLRNKFNLAATVQYWAEQQIMKLATKARKYGSKLCYSGGVAQNIIANSQIKELFDDVHIAVNPGDSGSSLGAAARAYGLATGKDKINYVDPYLGYKMGEINAKEVVDYLLEHSYCGIASGRAEFGPRALGNRSLIADPRRDVKDTVNKIKRRQEFRPFAPAILEEYADEYFEGPMNEYMQYTCKAKHDYSSVTHIDGTARVQIVRKDCKSVLRPILEEFYNKTKVPMLLNTSLNIRGKPIVNNKYDCSLFEKLNNTKVFYNDTR